MQCPHPEPHPHDTRTRQAGPAGPHPTVSPRCPLLFTLLRRPPHAPVCHQPPSVLCSQSPRPIRPPGWIQSPAAGAETVSGLCSSLRRKHHVHAPPPHHGFLPHPSNHPPGRAHRCPHGRGSQPSGGGDGAGCVAGGAAAGGAAGAGGGCGGYGQSGGAGESARRA